jgi:oxalate decarboxylase
MYVMPTSKSAADTADIVGPTPIVLRFLEVFRGSRSADLSLNQWIKLTPSELVRSHLHIDRALLDGLAAGKRPVLPSNRLPG